MKPPSKLLVSKIMNEYSPINKSHNISMPNFINNNGITSQSDVEVLFNLNKFLSFFNRIATSSTHFILLSNSITFPDRRVFSSVNAILSFLIFSKSLVSLLHISYS